jgi:Terpene synthase family 2, C-terminal metal binding
VPEDVIQAPGVRAYQEACCLIAALDNERVSAVKEQLGEGELGNLTDVLAAERGYQGDEAQAVAIALRAQMMDVFVALRTRLEAQAEPALLGYLNHLAIGVRGNIDWSLNTVRYRVTDALRELAPTASLVLDAGYRQTPSSHPDADAKSLAPIAWWWNQLGT